MRWEQLFGDLEAQLEAAERDDFEGEVSDRTRREVAQTGLVDRLRAATGSRLELSVSGVGVVTAIVGRVGVDWILLSESGTAAMLVPLAAIVTIRNLGRSTAPAADAVAAGLDVRFVLRGIARDRVPVTVNMYDGAALSGTIDRVGADFLDLAEHPLDVPRRAAAVPAIRTVPLAVLGTVRFANAG